MKHPLSRITAASIISTLFGVLLFSSVAVQARDLPDFTTLVEQYGPSVVNISTTQKIKHPKPRQMPQMPDLPEDSPLNDLFRHFFEDRPDGPPQEFDAQSLGSGFIISSEGYVLTNNHVVKGADKILVRLSDRRELVAQVVGTDPRSDIALLKIKAENLPVVKIGDPSKIKVGEWVLAIGSPFGFDHSATAGIVSAIGRSLPTESYVPFIQTDVAINPGNSGGPLFNLDGEVIGINSQIFSRTGGFMGLSFAIPSDVAMDVVEQLKSKGHVTRGWLGIIIQDVTRDLAESFGMTDARGALVARILPGGPAEKVGIQVGDIVTEFDGKPVIESANLPKLVGRSKVGSEYEVKLIRNGKPVTLKIKLAELPKEEELKLAQGTPKTAEANRVAITVADLSAEQRKQLDVKSGVLVQQVDSGPAQRAGIRRGDVILKINNLEIKDSNHFSEVVKGLPVDASVPVLVQRGNGALFLALKITKEDEQ
jgi:serine protease Do